MTHLDIGPVVGQIGGVDVQKVPVDIVADGATNSVVVMRTVHVPEGETWLIVLSGDLDPNVTHSGGPVLSIGEESIGPQLRAGYTALAAEVTGTAEITLKRNQSLGADTFSGHVYTVPLP